MSAVLKSVPAAVVGRRDVSIYELLFTMKLQGDLNPVFARAITTVLVLEAAKREGMTCTLDEVQAEQDRVRAQLGLRRAAATRLWLKRVGMTEEELQLGAERRVLGAKLRAQVTADVESYFDEHGDEFPFDRLDAERREVVAQRMWDQWLDAEAERQNAILTLPSEIHP